MNARHRILFLVLAGVVLAGAGCFSRRDTTGTAASTNALPRGEDLIITPAASPVGRVASVNLQGRFVVLSFPLGQVPSNETRLNLYRAGAKVGELRVTGPQHDTLTVADITTGSAREGDEASVD